MRIYKYDYINIPKEIVVKYLFTKTFLKGETPEFSVEYYPYPNKEQFVVYCKPKDVGVLIGKYGWRVKLVKKLAMELFLPEVPLFISVHEGKEEYENGKIFRFKPYPFKYNILSYKLKEWTAFKDLDNVLSYWIVKNINKFKPRRRRKKIKAYSSSRTPKATYSS